MPRALIVLFAVLIGASGGGIAQDRVSELPGVTREEMLAIANKLAAHKWTCKAGNLKAPCVRSYTSDFEAGQVVTGLPYDWGGMDDAPTFDKKLAAGQAAGSHSRHGITNCTAGIDCSGFVSMCWKQRPNHEFSTRTIRSIAGRPRYNIYTDMKPGDALNKPGEHIVLFTGYGTDGSPRICEASGSAKRVVCRARTWSQLRGYYPLIYKMVVE